MCTIFTTQDETDDEGFINVLTGRSRHRTTDVSGKRLRGSSITVDKRSTQGHVKEVLCEDETVGGVGDPRERPGTQRPPVSSPASVALSFSGGPPESVENRRQTGLCARLRPTVKATGETNLSSETTTK